MPVMRGVDTYVGRKAVAISDEDEDGYWSLTLEGDVKIINHDPLLDKPPEQIIGLPLLVVIMDARTQLVFGYPSHDEWRVPLTGIKYAILDLSVSNTPYFPQDPISNRFPPKRVSEEDYEGAYNTGEVDYTEESDGPKTD